MDPDDPKSKKNNLTPSKEEITDDESVEEVIACVSAKKKAARRKRMMISDDEQGESSLEQAKKFRTESGRNVRRKLAFDELKNERDHKQKGPSSKPCNASEGSSEESECSSYHGSDERSEDESDLDLSSVDEDSESQDLASSSLERYSDESGPENFGVDEVDDHFKKAQTYWERLINTKKESVVASSRWRDYKEKLKKCKVVTFRSLKRTTKHQRCEACLIPRFLKERVECEEPDGEVKQKFKVCQSCAAKGSVYHDLHHYKQQLKENCSEQLEKVQQMAGTETPEGIIKKCLDDERWLDRLFSQFQSTLDAANKWAID
ncbi:hypothetical protein pdam_00020839 [Pocillopora damicornis]|uniref:DUF4211 domain-containing protein n=1 Tax=Pocillopora damicornis TaxID=46731 RepID=A0A3M6THB4_POCDA|nr:hypothetical protein pdam_00020839 [Pocillopora damicornis]